MEIDPLFGPAAPELGWVPAPRYALRRARILGLADRLPRGRALEIGPGAGALLHDLAARGFACEGLEPSAPARTLARQMLASRPAVSLYPEAQADWQARFDLVVACEVLEHIEDDRSALGRWLGWLRPGGHLLASVPARKQRWGPTDDWAGHVRRYERDELMALLASSGLELQALECYGFPASNLIEPLRSAAHRRALRRRTTLTQEQSTAQSGVARSLELRLYPWQCSPPGRLAFRAARALQVVFRHRDWGTGYLALGRKP
jgi:SAM-dependent methyltransferase